MSDTLSDKIVEVGEDAVLREIKRLAGACVTTECVQPGGCKETCGIAAAWATHIARACLSAALVAVEAEGVVLARVPEREPDGARTDALARWRDGYNACRATVLAGKVTL
jgi:hypothetical protein